MVYHLSEKHSLLSNWIAELRDVQIHFIELFHEGHRQEREPKEGT